MQWSSVVGESRNALLQRDRIDDEKRDEATSDVLEQARRP